MEFALILPILLLLVLGSIEVGLAMVTRYELVHAATEGAIAGASTPGDRCADAMAVTAAIYGRQLTDLACEPAGTSLAVTAGVDLPLFVPVGRGVWHIVVTERSELRR